MSFQRAALLACLVTLIAPCAMAQAPSGRYECWYGGSARLGLNFALLGDGHYTDVDGTSGTVSVSGGQLVFRNGALDGLRAVYRGGNPSTINILGPRGDELYSCELSR